MRWHVPKYLPTHKCKEESFRTLPSYNNNPVGICALAGVCNYLRGDHVLLSIEKISQIVLINALGSIVGQINLLPEHFAHLTAIVAAFIQLVSIP